MIETFFFPVLCPYIQLLHAYNFLVLYPYDPGLVSNPTLNKLISLTIDIYINPFILFRLTLISKLKTQISKSL
ncbi:LOW QUALITY PROTEIN: Peptidase M14, carboxypeptidase A [Parasponia andersonii]|uniref:Peptidase M14, carboxypeptidase A n=1 Tax=Parasponia andersonii TaxID=3476 RepID=A0A2P5ACB8_PARAD|nr:LOW QUALITY PROTEIN: Peptidase M14, carboxypeptidase A [Parasponia andersonii]